MKDFEHQIEQSWNDNAEAWTRSVREQQIESRKLVTDRAVINEISSYQPRKVLDVGCGEGWLARMLSEWGMEVVGFDGSRELVEKAQSIGGGLFYHLNYMDFCEDPAQLGSGYDAIVCNFSLFSQDIKIMLRSLSSLLSADGVFIIQTLHPFTAAQHERYEDGWREESFAGMGEGYKTAMPWFFRTMGSWLNELHDAGLILQKCTEPIHPISGKPLSLLLTAIRNQSSSC